MSFSIKCNTCKYSEEKKDEFWKKDDISVEIIGDDIVKITCGFCRNEITSFND